MIDGVLAAHISPSELVRVCKFTRWPVSAKEDERLRKLLLFFLTRHLLSLSPLEPNKSVSFLLR